MSGSCLVLDVGQGSANLVRLTNGRVVIIDCGPANQRALVDALSRIDVRSIEALILSHNDIDHTGGTNGVIETFHRIIRKVYLLDDRAPGNNATWQLLKAKFSPEFRRTNVHDLKLRMDKPWRVLERRSGSAKISLWLLHPTFDDVLEAKERQAPNDSCGVLVLKHGDQKIVFAGDAPIRVWEEIYRRRDKEPLEVDVITVPHHGGKAWSGNVRSAPKQLDWLFQTAVRPKYAALSVGTSNPHDHPREEVIESLRRADCGVLCTQITSRCCAGAQLDDMRHRLLQPLHPSASTSTNLRTRSGAPKHVGCATTIMIELGESALSIERLQEHADAVDRLVARNGIVPLCRKEV